MQLGTLLERLRASSPTGRPLDSEADWSGILSLGEQQRLAFARLLLTRPRLALMDEATSALDQANERKLYEAVQAAGVTAISVGHRPSLLRYHQQVLQIEAGGAWQLLPAESLLAQATV